MLLRDSIAAVVIFGLSLAVFLIAGSYPSGAQVFPRAVTVVMMIVSALLLLQSVYRPVEPGEESKAPSFKIIVCITATIALVFAVDYIGYVTAGIIYVPLVSYFLGVRNHLAVWVGTIVFLLVVAFLFRSIFHVPLPKEFILTLF